MSEYLSREELADLTESPQPSRWIPWLQKRGWKFDVGAHGTPRVLRAYRDRRLGVNTVDPKPKPEDGLDWKQVA